ncbi:MAG: hypothetical protein NVS1B2_11130 [Vulcanimicrobiaceae bacterium]
MARVRRKARATTHALNLEIAGIAAFGIALLLGIALSTPTHAGAIGLAVARALVAAFGNAAGFVPIVVAILGGIVFLEINVPRLLATLGFASVCSFLIIDAAYARGGGTLGRLLHRGLVALVGDTGATIVLVLFAFAIAVWHTPVTVKRLIALGIVTAARARARVVEVAAAARAKRADAPAVASPPGPTSLREAFELPQTLPKPRRTQATVAPSRDVEPARAGDDARDTAVPSDAMAPPIEPTAPTTTSSVLATLAPIAPIDAKTFVKDDGSQRNVGIASVLDPQAASGETIDAEAADVRRNGNEAIDDVAAEDDADESARADGRIAVGMAARAVAAATPPAAAAREAETFGSVRRQYRLPDLALFDPPQAQVIDDSHRSHLLEDTLASFGVGAKVTHIERGPSITRYELKPERGVKISRISSLADDIALALAATSVRIEAPIPGKSAIGVEVPNAVTSVVAISEILQALPFRGTVPPLHMALGKDITGRAVFGDLGKMPHLLVAGATGSGKSVCLNGIIASLLVSATPDEVQMLFVDPKRVELTIYNGIPHLIKPAITDAKLAAGALYEMTREMDSRYERFAKAGVRKIEEYNNKFPDEKLPFIVIVIDELADLMLIAPAKVETTICRLAQLARATGIHLIVATQRPSVDVITGIIKANIPSRIAFAVSSQIDSRTILDMGGAERLLGRGDMLFLPIDAPKPIRAQGALITGAEVTRLVEFWAAQARPDNLLDVEFTPIEEDDKSDRKIDPFLYEAAKFIIDTKFASTAQVQQRFQVGHPRAVRIMKSLEEFGVVGPHEGTKPRQINIGHTELESIAERLGRSDQVELFGA